MDINWQSVSIYGYFVTSLTAYYSCADIRLSDYMLYYWKMRYTADRFSVLDLSGLISFKLIMNIRKFKIQYLNNLIVIQS